MHFHLTFSFLLPLCDGICAKFLFFFVARFKALLFWFDASLYYATRRDVCCQFELRLWHIFIAFNLIKNDSLAFSLAKFLIEQFKFKRFDPIGELFFFSHHSHAYRQHTNHWYSNFIVIRAIQVFFSSSLLSVASLLPPNILWHTNTQEDWSRPSSMWCKLNGIHTQKKIAHNIELVKLTSFIHTYV